MHYNHLNMQRIKILDSMRGLAAAIVVFHHVYTRFSYLYIRSEHPLLHRLLGFISYLNVEAVLFFFVLSGFSIRLSLKKGLPVTKELFNEYVYRRLKRILPLYYFAIIFTLLCGWVTRDVLVNPDFTIKNLLGNIFFLQCPKIYKGNWFAPYGDNGPLWSLSFEMFYYFFFPVFILLMLNIFKKMRTIENRNRLFLCCSFLLSVSCVAVNKQFFFPYIAFAAFFFIWYNGFFIADLYLQKRISFNSDFIINIILMILAGILIYFKPSAGLSNLFSGAAICVVFFIVYLFRFQYRKFFIKYIERVLNFLFAKIGKGSYALYLFHYPLILVLKYYRAHAWLIISSIAVLAICCIWLEQYIVKRKLLFLKRRYIR
jgi:peptidoglycan/LPS O-acetylase OafA/YrhL